MLGSGLRGAVRQAKLARGARSIQSFYQAEVWHLYISVLRLFRLAMVSTVHLRDSLPPAIRMQQTCQGGHISVHFLQVTSTGGRDAGSVRSSDGNLILKTSLPRGLGGKSEQLDTTNPEQLFAAGRSL